MCGRPRGQRVAGATAVVVAGVGGLVACEPGAISSVTVAYTTDELVTRELERQKADVQWLSCTADFGERSGSTPSAGVNTVADVDCEGQTSDGKDITVTGKVTRAVDGACVRGDLTARIDGREWFRVSGLGDCDATSAPPVDTPPGGGPTTTVTVTKTVYCQSAPPCRPEGK
ncbi:hypothetical protein KWI83_19075 [Streptomyces sp. TRM70350]|nr:hypothetical protein [Streptomyces sp. TRM70350]MBV7697674.1 hypothetical protein [Streptomyces sp. TRM70350]